jgi:hypothetical protein
VLQMHGQPTAQNTRECGADGDLPGFRNWHNPDHIDELARLWPSRPGGNARGAGPATTRASARPAAGRRRDPVAGHRDRPRRHRAPVRRRALPHRPRGLRGLRPRPGHQGRAEPPRSTGPSRRPAVPSCGRPTTSRGSSSPTRSSRCC